MKVIVLGAGVIGTTAAYYLNRAGCDVTVVDRQASPAAETSFANGGQVSVSHAEPWANPSAPLKLLRWLAREDAPLLFRLRADMHQWLWGLAFLRECTPARTRNNIGQIVRLGMYSRTRLQELRRKTGIAYDHQERGILHFYTDAKEFEAALAPAEQMNALGVKRHVISAAEAVATREGKKELLNRAKEHEKTRDHAMRQDPWFDYAEGLLQIAIVLLSVSILGSIPSLFIVGSILGLLGLLSTLNGFLLLI